MKKLIACLLTVTLMLSMTGCGDEGKRTENPENQETIAGAIQVEKELFDVVITFPADLMGETSQEELDKMVQEGVVHSAVLNQDGSVTYEMSKRQHKKIMKAMEEEFEKSVSELVGSAEYPNFTEIQIEDNFTHFKVFTKSEELDLSESFSVLFFYMIGGMYSVLSGNNEPVIVVDFINADTGKVIETADSSQMQ